MNPLTDSNSDAELIRLIIRGNDDALRILYERHVNSVFTFITRLAPPSIDPQDIVQDAFIKAWRNITQYDASYSFRTWIFTIARNVLRDQIRKKLPTAFTDLDTEDGLPFEENIVDDRFTKPYLEIDHVFNQRILEEALQKLSLSQKEVILLHAIEQFTFQEIADTIKEPMDTVKTRYRRSLQKLKMILEPEKDRLL
ncbi:RNA polymerase sigma factor [Candidatus Uhrbacteria bacterium]|nr:RNA polymerase sigma factor [Candidatus Uhrbacteria bacterium]